MWDDHIFLTGFSEGKLETICLHRRDDTVRWRRVAPAERLEAFHPTEGTPATATPATDGQRVVVYFGSCGLRAYNFEGREFWHLPLPVPRQVGDFGSGTSPVLDGVVTVLAAADAFRVLAQTDFKDRLAAMPALAENRLYLRTDKHLYAFGEP